MKLKLFIAKLSLIFIYFLGIIAIFFSFKKTNQNLLEINLNSNYIYSIEYKNRFIYFDYNDYPIMILDRFSPGILNVVFDKNDFTEKKIVKNISLNSNILKIDFKNNKVFCYNDIEMKFFNKNDLYSLREKDLKNLDEGKYFIIKDMIIKSN